ncbi:MAG TPA: metallopeptidase TldD-related protein [Micromonosporaceae bacterium]
MTTREEREQMTEVSTEQTAAQVIDLVRSANPRAQAEVVVDRVDRALTRFANSYIHQNVAESTGTVRLRLHLDGRTANGSTTRIDRDGLATLVDTTVAAARHCPRDPQWPGLAPQAPTGATGDADPDTAYAPPRARAERVRAFVDAAGGLETAGYCATARWVRGFANSAGQTAWAQTAEAAMDGIARTGGADGVARLTSTRLDQLDGAVLGARAAAKARASVGAQPLAPGRYEVVLEPTAAVDLIYFLGVYGFNAKAMAEQRSFVELGAAQFDPAITLLDDPFQAGGAALPFDIEGTPRRRLALIERGISLALTHDRRTAVQLGGTSTGHATPPVPSIGSPGPLAPNLHLLPGGGAAATEVDSPAADSAVLDLVTGVRRGLLVTDNWYTRVLDPRTLVVTGLTRNGVWLIENGEITTPVQNLRFTQSYPDALAAGAVLGVGSHAVPLPTGWEASAHRVPALRLASWNYTGNAAG